jgi:hypothetical protein
MDIFSLYEEKNHPHYKIFFHIEIFSSKQEFFHL